jgi:hypothetical protein
MLSNVPAPQEQLPSAAWEHLSLYTQIREVLREIPTYFRSTISVSGIHATEIYGFSSILGLTIEQEIVSTLNRLRHIWEGDANYRDYRFVRQAQSFPDVLLLNSGTRHIVMGIELKSWYLLAKEGEPSFRYKVSPNACNVQDLLVVVPWILSNVLAGTPIVYAPFVTSARYAAERRNHWWQHEREAKSDTTIHPPTDVVPYGKVRDKTQDHPASDNGGNFGRIARIGLLDEYIQSFDSQDLLGISVKSWRQFLKRHIIEDE